MMPSDFPIVPMAPANIRQVAELERQCFSDPWPEEILRGELTNPLSLWLVALDGADVAGYVGSQSVLKEADMMNLAVRPDCRRRGLGMALVTELEVRLKGRGVGSLALEVRVTNQPAICLYQALGFTQVGRRPRYYCHPEEDALILKKTWSVGHEHSGN